MSLRRSGPKSLTVAATVFDSKDFRFCLGWIKYLLHSTTCKSSYNLYVLCFLNFWTIFYVSLLKWKRHKRIRDGPFLCEQIYSFSRCSTNYFCHCTSPTVCTTVCSVSVKNADWLKERYKEFINKRRLYLSVVGEAAQPKSLQPYNQLHHLTLKWLL